MSLFDDVKRLLPLSDAGTKHDELIASLIESVKEQAYGYMQVRMDSVVNAQAVYDGGSTRILLPHLNVIAATVVADENTLVDGYEYYLYRDRGIIRAAAGMTIGRRPRGVVVIYTGGWTEDAMPASFLRAVAKQVTFEFRRRTDPGLSATVYPDGTVQKMIVDEWLPDVLAELNRWRRYAL